MVSELMMIQINLPWQSVPWVPGLHVQLWEWTVFTHLPPFMHGLLLHPL